MDINDIKNNLKNNLLDLRKEIQKDDKNIEKIKSLYNSIDEDLNFVKVDSRNVNNFKNSFSPALNYEKRQIIGAVITRTPVDNFILFIDNLFNDINGAI